MKLQETHLQRETLPGAPEEEIHQESLVTWLDNLPGLPMNLSMPRQGRCVHFKTLQVHLA